MKIRNGFVSNSSASSFTILTENLTPKQKEQLLNYNNEEYYDYWDLFENDSFISGITIIDNGDIHDFFKKIGIDFKYVNFEGD